MPVVLYQAWAFVAPGLYKKEKRFAIPLVISSIVLFYAGVAFAYGIVFPLMFAFFNSVAPEGVAVMTDINNYLDFVLVILFAFGLSFEVPIATVMLVWAGLTTPKKLSEIRAYVFLGAFVAGMLLTPPDIISQTLLAVPIYLLFEAGIIMSRFLLPEKAADTEPKAGPDAAG
jgi:sec-independent protein translocase protein TatC